MNQGIDMATYEESTRPAGRIKNSLNDLIGEIEQTQLLIEELEHYMMPALKPSSPEEGKSGTPVDPKASQLTTILEDLGTKIVSTNRAIRSIIDRIEL